MCPTTAAVWQGCTRGVVLSSCCLAPVICGVSKISDPLCLYLVRKNTLVYLDLNVRMGWYINYYKSVSILPPKLARSMDMQWRCARSGSTAEIWGMVG